MIDGLAEACARNHSTRITVADIQKALGERSFGPLILVPGLIGVSPIGAIPGVPAVTSLIVFLVTAQILFGMRHFWLPGGLRRRSLEADRLKRALDFVRPYARVVDRFLLPRLTLLTRGVFLYVLAAMCLLISVVTPIIEFVPLAGVIPNAAIVAFALAITAHDGLWAVFAFAFTAGSFYLVFSFLWG